MSRCPCRVCTDRTLTCHGVCRKYQEWKKEHENEKSWLKSHTVQMTTAQEKGYTRKLRNQARGWNRKIGRGNGE